MRRHYVLVALPLAAAILAACSNPAAPQLGSLSVKITETVSGRTVLPTLSMTPASYEITGSGPDGATFSQKTDGATNSATVADLAFGSWDVTVSAYNSDGTLIGQGTKTGATVNTGKTTEVTVTVVPLPGNGTLAVSASWSDTKVQTPYLSLVITPTSGTAITVDASAKGEATWSYSNKNLPSGYYTVSLNLKDDGDGTAGSGDVVAGAADSVRIVQDQTTTWAVAYNDINPSGGITTTITPQLSDPLTVSLTRSSTAFKDESLLNFAASQSGYAGTATYVWYLNGEAPPSGSVDGSILSLPNSLREGYYRVDVIATGTTQEGSASFVFWWKGSLSSAPPSPKSDWAYFNSTTGLPYIWDASSSAWQPFSTVPVHA